MTTADAVTKHNAIMSGFAGGSYVAKLVKAIYKMQPALRLSFIVGAVAGIRSVDETTKRLIDPKVMSDFAESCENVTLRIHLNDAVEWLQLFEKEGTK